MAFEVERLLLAIKGLDKRLADIQNHIVTGITITVRHQHDTEVHRKLDTLISQGATMSTDLTHIKASVEAIKGRAASIEALVVGLAELVRAIPTTDPNTQAAIDKLAGELDTEAAGMQAVIDANPLPHEAPPAAVVLPSGNVGAAYSAGLQLPAGTAPYTNTVVAGAVPPGLAVDLTAPVINGVPETAGTFAFTVNIVDSDAGTADETTSYTLTVA